MASAKFSDLYKYIQSASRDNVGMHDPFPGSKIYPRYMFHIYNNLRQVNITMATSPDDPGNSIVNFCFRPEENEVVVYPVNNGICDYDNGNAIPIDTEITKANGWCNKLRNGGAINEVLRDTLGNMVAEKEKASNNYGSNTPLHVSTKHLYSSLNAKIHELNALNRSYPRNAGTLRMANAENENRIESLCKEMYRLIDQLESPERVAEVDPEDRDTYKKALTDTRIVLDNNMTEVRISRDFLAKYSVH